jgi:hypothetical protein
MVKKNVVKFDFKNGGIVTPDEKYANIDMELIRDRLSQCFRIPRELFSDINIEDL